MERSDIISQQVIRAWLKQHQRRLGAGDKLPSISEICRRGGIHRDSAYSLLAGNHIETRTQVALSRVIKEVELETAVYPKTKVLSIRMDGGSPRIQMGIKYPDRHLI